MDEILIDLFFYIFNKGTTKEGFDFFKNKSSEEKENWLSQALTAGGYKIDGPFWKKRVRDIEFILKKGYDD